MLVAVHVILASLSIVLAVFNLVKPSKRGLLAVYGLTGGAALSGAALVFVTQANMLQSCMSGSLFLGFIIVSSYFSAKRVYVAGRV